MWAKLFKLVKLLITEQIQTQSLIPLMFFIFIMILYSNIIGMVPYTITITSQIIMTLTIALVSFITINILYAITRKLHGIELFLPTGTPLFIIPFLIQIEVISYMSRVLSLSIRLFANMTSGHTLIKILSGFSTSLISANTFGGLLSIFTLIVIFAVTGLEVVIAVLQTYVFVILMCIYLHELETGH